ncbi:MAG: alpha-glucan family phosphorylase [Cytophagaceae bacterium]|nr:alpha-glucan family phosphorylase [Cytophagaceae bacterium]
MDNDNKKVAYFSMEYAVDQSLKIYSGGLGFLAGSYFKSTYALKKNMIGIGILYTNGYYDQVRNYEGYVEVKYTKKRYSFLKDTGIIFPITVHGNTVWVKVYLLPSEIFQTSPIYLLTTDIPQNDFLARSISFRLYDNNLAAKIAQFMLLGIGGGKLIDILNYEPDVYHLNEGHGLPLIFHLLSKYQNPEEVRKRLVFTTHTPEKAGNDEIPVKLLEEMSFFDSLSAESAKGMTGEIGDQLNFTLTALRMSRKTNGVSEVHGKVANAMWGGNPGISKIISITNAQSREFWMDKELERHLHTGDDAALIKRKSELKKSLFRIVADQTGKLFSEDICTIVWARRITSYKRPDLLIKDINRFMRLVNNQKYPLQVIWAGKTYPEDYGSIDMFNKLVGLTNDLPNCTVLTGYEMSLSASLKKGADIWLNTPRYTREASGTSGMSAAMNGAVNLSIPDGWVPEFAKHGENSFIIPVDSTASYEKQDEEDNKNLMDILEQEVIPVYYNEKNRWLNIMKASMNDVVPMFNTERMVHEYYEKLYK